VEVDEEPVIKPCADMMGLSGNIARAAKRREHAGRELAAEVIQSER
jgi:hypothetical protein